jgi:hypothetical protein
VLKHLKEASVAMMAKRKRSDDKAMAQRVKAFAGTLMWLLKKIRAYLLFSPEDKCAKF